MPRPCKLTFDLLTLKVVSESRVTWTTSVPILVFLGLSVLDLGLMYATDRRQTSDAHHRLMPLYGGGGITRRYLCIFVSNDELHFLHYLLPVKRDTELINRLRSVTVFPPIACGHVLRKFYPVLCC